MPILTQAKQGYHASWPVWAAVLLLCVLLAGVLAWSWFVTPVYVPFGRHGVGFGQLYTSKRPPPPGRRRLRILGDPTARYRVFPIADRPYLIGWR
jgi:hypothetical protein